MKTDNIVFIFDFDGVIVDSVEALYNIYLDFLIEFGVKGNKEEFTLLNGPTIPEIVTFLKNKHSIDENRESLLEIYYKKLSSIYNKVKLNNGIEEILRLLKCKNIKIALASSSKKDKINSLLKKFELKHYFDFVVTGDDVKKAKPSPEIFNAVKKTYPKHEYYVIEDSENGLQSAMNAGMYTIFLNPENNATKKEVTYEISSLHQIDNIVKEISLNCFTISKANKISLKVVKHKFNINESQKQTIEKLWNDELKTKQLFNGNIVSYLSHKKKHGILNIECFVTEYKYFFAQLKKPELNLNIAPIGVSGIIIDEYNNTILAIRQNVTEYEGYYELIPAGSIETSKRKNDVILFQEQLAEEYKEETQTSTDNIKSIKPYCLIFDKTHGVYDICSKIYINGPASDIIESKQNDEYKNIKIMGLKKAYNKIQDSNCVPTSIIILNNLSL